MVLEGTITTKANHIFIRSYEVFNLTAFLISQPISSFLALSDQTR
jgi:hypothetical protein